MYNGNSFMQQIFAAFHQCAGMVLGSGFGGEIKAAPALTGPSGV